MIYIPIGSTSAAIHVLARILAKLFWIGRNQAKTSGVVAAQLALFLDRRD